MGRVKAEHFKVGDLVFHRIFEDDAFRLGIVIGHDWSKNAVYVRWSAGKKVYHIPEMLKRLE
jgi:hypothetical protein